MASEFDLPKFNSLFIGRKRELELIHRLLHDPRFYRETIVKIIGPGGSGKTSLAQEAARRHPWLTPIFVNFEEQRDDLSIFNNQYLERVLLKDYMPETRERERDEVLVILDGVENASDSRLSEFLRVYF